MTRDIFILTKNPKLHKKWINTVVGYIRDNYDKAEVDAIVGPDTRGFVFALIIARELKLPYIPIHKVGKVPTDSADVIQRAYINRKDKVSVVLEIYNCAVILADLKSF